MTDQLPAGQEVASLTATSPAKKHPLRWVALLVLLASGAALGFRTPASHPENSADRTAASVPPAACEQALSVPDDGMIDAREHVMMVRMAVSVGASRDNAKIKVLKGYLRELDRRVAASTAAADFAACIEWLHVQRNVKGEQDCGRAKADLAAVEVRLTQAASAYLQPLVTAGYRRDAPQVRTLTQQLNAVVAATPVDRTRAEVVDCRADIFTAS